MLPKPKKKSGFTWADCRYFGCGDVQRQLLMKMFDRANFAENAL